MTLLAPDLALALEASELFVNGEGPAEAAAAALEPVLHFAREGVRLFEMLAPALLRNENVNELLRQVELEQRAQLDGAESLLKAARAGRALGQKNTMRSFRAACERLPGLLAQLQREEVKSGASSVFPIVDTLIKASWNCLHGEVDRNVLKPRLDAALGLARSLKGDVERFRRLIGRPELVAATQEPFRLLEAGIGAGLSYWRSGRKGELEDSLRLLLQASPKLADSLSAIDRAAVEDARYSKRRYLEELGRINALPREQQSGLVEGAWARLTQVQRHIERELEALAASPLQFEIAPQLEACEKLLQPAADAGRGGQASVAIAAFEQLEQAYDELRERVREERARFARLPHLGELRDLVGRALLGQVTPEVFLAVIDENRERQQHFLDTLEAGASNLDMAELAQVVQTHGPALDMMAQWVQGSNTFFLLGGWRQISASAPRLQQLSDKLRR